MIDQQFFEGEQKMEHVKQKNMMNNLFLLFKRNVVDAFTDTFKKGVLKVSVQEDKQADERLNKILSQLYAVNLHLKSLGKVSGGGKVSIKTPDLITLNKEIEKLLRQIAQKELVLKIPDKQRIFGEVKVSQIPELGIKALSNNLEAKLDAVISVLSNLNLEVPPFPKIEQPKINIPKFPDSVSLTESKAILKALKDLRDEIKKIPDNIPEMEFPRTVSVDNFPIPKYPNPVTNININPLRGSVEATAVSVGTTATALPDTPLDYRRSVMVFNNESSATVYLGGESVDTTNGLPVLAQTYSPVIDAGPRMILYGIVASGTADVRVIEASNEDIGG